jgi:hypothetical protein
MRRSLSTSRDSLIFASAALILAIAAVAAGVWIGERDDLSLVWALTFLLITAGLSPILGEWLKGTLDVFNLRNFVVIYYLLQFGGYTIYILGGFQRPEHFTATIDPAAYRSELLETLLYAILGLGCYYAGYYGKWRFTRSRPRQAQGSEERLMPGRLVCAIAVLAGISFVMFFWLMQARGGLSHYISNLLVIRSEELLGLGFLLYGLVPISIAFLLCYTASVRDQRFRLPSYGLFVGSIAVALLGGHRHLAIAIVVYAFVVRHYLVARFRLNRTLIGWCLVAFVLNAAYVEYRSRSARNPLEAMDQAAEVRTDSERFNRLVVETTIGRFHGTISMVRILNRIDALGHTWGWYQLRDLLVAPIPRFVWPDKPLSSGHYFNVFFFDAQWQSTGVAVPTMLGELYWMFASPGIILGMFLYGMISRRLFERVRSNPTPRMVRQYAIAVWVALFINETITLSLFQLAVTSAILVISLRLIEARGHVYARAEMSAAGRRVAIGAR